jgi:hypothetical protein
MGSVIRASCIGLVFCICGLAQSSSATNMQLVVQVRSEAAIAWQGENAVLVKVRLGPGIQARVWTDDSCGTPSVNGQVIRGSGTYTIPLAAIDGSGTANICLSSSDGGLRTVLPTLVNKHGGGP